MQPSSDSQDRHPTVEDGHTTVRRVTVPEAANILGVTPDAIRSRLRRGKLRKDTAADGTVLVVLDFEATDGHDGQEAKTDGQATVNQLVDSLQSQVEHLRRQLDEANRANAEHRRLLAAALERIPAAIEPPEEITPETREDHETVSPETEGVETPLAEEKSVSWWRKLFSG